MALLAGLGISVLLLATVVGVLPVVRWVLRPVDELGATAARLAAGDLTARASERGGPPELRGLAAAFNRMAASLGAALERQRAFVADASHELRNPLGTLRLRLDALAGSLHGEDLRGHDSRSPRASALRGRSRACSSSPAPRRPPPSATTSSSSR